MIVVEKIMMQRRDPNGLQKEYHKSDRIATAMCDAAGFDAEYAGMAVHRADARSFSTVLMSSIHLRVTAAEVVLLPVLKMLRQTDGLLCCSFMARTLLGVSLCLFAYI